MSNLRIIYDKLKKAGLCDNGIYGLMGNLKAESNFQPNNLQNTYQTKLGHTDESYTKAVDDGSYTNFVKDSAGYGLAQWTYWSRKQNLLDFAKNAGKSIGDLEMQVDFMIKELKGYKTVWNVLINATTIKEASDVVLTQYERPADQSDAVKEKRAKFGVETKTTLEAENNAFEGSIRDKVLYICNQELGVAEPTGDDKYIDWFNKNVLKTWSFAMNVAWCSIFATYAGVMAGLTSKEMPLTAGCDEGMNWFKNKKQWEYSQAYGGTYIPKKGDMIYYSGTNNQNDSTHVGWVESCDGTLLTAVEGNNSNKVNKRTIYLSNSYILGFGLIKYPDETNKEVTIDNRVIAGKKVVLMGTPCYVSETATAPYDKKDGVYYLWDANVNKGRIRITNLPERVGVQGQVTCFVNVADISLVSEGQSNPVIGTSNKLAGTGIGTAVALSTMNVRDKAGTTGNIIGWLNKGKSVEVLAVTEGNWLKVVWDTAEDGFAYVSNTKPYFSITYKEESYKQKSEYKEGDIVNFKGTKHYTSAGSASGKDCKPGKAKVTQLAEGKKHPIHLIAVDGGGSNVYGWVDASDITPLTQTGYKTWVGKVANCSVLNVRTGAGVENGKLQAWPQLVKGNLVDVLGEVKASNGVTWYYINIQGNKGYVNSSYIEKA